LVSCSLVALPSVFRKVPYGLFSLVFPDECRICKVELSGCTRLPVCASCLTSLSPLAAEYFCVSCRTPLLNRFPLNERGMCRLCHTEARGFDAAYCFGAFDGTLRELIHLFKYGRMKPLAKTLAAYLATVLPRERRNDVVVPMPLHWRRRWQRGFNQSELLARATARRSGSPRVNAVRRTRATAAQAGLSNAGRRENVAGTFWVRKPRAIEARHVLLIDDVMTTGVTASSCALALKRAGAKFVALLALARVDRRLFKPANDAPEPDSKGFASAFSKMTGVS